MSGVDEELARAVAESEAAAQAEPVAVPVAAPPTKKKSSLGLLVMLVVMAAAILTLVFTSVNDSSIYSVDVSRLLAERAKYASRNLKVHGTLVKGTLVRRADPCEYRFRIGEKNAVLDVHYPQCIVPDTFRDMPGMDVEVTAEGHLASAGYFEASQIIAKCPSKYEMKQRASRGERVPHGAPLESMNMN
jgi:cytochrome c-type biogenesis protein CcmE